MYLHFCIYAATFLYLPGRAAGRRVDSGARSQPEAPLAQDPGYQRVHGQHVRVDSYVTWEQRAGEGNLVQIVLTIGCEFL
jgi:hypothetical protein